MLSQEQEGGGNNMKKRVISVIVTYNRKDLLKECIESLLNQTYKENQILIVDNHSTDGTKGMLDDYIKKEQIIYFDTGENKGGSYGFYIGEKLAVELGCDYVWLMDDDCIPTTDALEKLIVSAEKHKNFGYLASKVLWLDGNMCKMNIPKKNIAKHIKNYDVEQKVCLSSFVSCLIRREVIEDVGLSMKDFFIWGDDWEYTFRISKKYESFYVPSSVVVHKSKTNYGVNIAKADNAILQRYKYAYRNESYFYHQAGLSGRAYLLAKILLHTFRILVSKCDNKAERLKCVFKYTRQGKKFHPTITYTYDKNTPINILEITSDPIQYGGQEMFIMNMYKNFSNQNNHYTIATPFCVENAEIRNLLKPNDGLLEIRRNASSRFRKREMMMGVKKILDSKKFDVIHIHSGSIYALLNISKEAKKHKIKTIIVHSHLGGENNCKYRLIKRLSDKKIEKYATQYIACSNLAAEWKFPKSIVENNQYVVINNGIDIEKFTYDQKTRDKIRSENGIGERFTLMHVGRFAAEKNHAFFISLLPSIKNLFPDFKFICVGAGKEKDNFIKQLESSGLKEHFIFLEGISNVNEYLFAADCFLLPSLHEGFPIALIEAEATGLNCIYSDLITSEALLTDLTKQLSLNNVQAWVESIIEVHGNLPLIRSERKGYSKIVMEKGYDEKTSSSLLENIYRGY